MAHKAKSFKLDEKKKEKRLLRYRSLAEAAAKQSKRSVIPQIHDFMTFHEAHSYAKECDINIVPYENATGMLSIKNTLEKIKEGMSISVFIGPEGGFDETEIREAMDKGLEPVTLGRRILRTETAGMTVLAWIVYLLEGKM